MTTFKAGSTSPLNTELFNFQVWCYPISPTARGLSMSKLVTSVIPSLQTVSKNPMNASDNPSTTCPLSAWWISVCHGHLQLHKKLLSSPKDHLHPADNKLSKQKCLRLRSVILHRELLDDMNNQEHRWYHFCLVLVHYSTHILVDD